jgi:hypothetical protein
MPLTAPHFVAPRNCQAPTRGRSGNDAFARIQRDVGYRFSRPGGIRAGPLPSRLQISSANTQEPVNRTDSAVQIAAISKTRVNDPWWRTSKTSPLAILPFKITSNRQRQTPYFVGRVLHLHLGPE